MPRSDALQRFRENAGDTRKRLPAKGNRCDLHTHCRHASTPSGRTWCSTPAGGRVLRALTVTACVPYLALKIAWASGSRVGIPAGSTLLEHHAAMIDGSIESALLDSMVVALALLLTQPWGRRAPGWPHLSGVGRHRSAQPDHGRLSAATWRSAARRSRGARRPTGRPPVPARVGVHRRLHRLHRPGARPGCTLRPVRTRALGTSVARPDLGAGGAGPERGAQRATALMASQ